MTHNKTGTGSYRNSMFVVFLLRILAKWTPSGIWSPRSFPKRLISNTDAADYRLALADFWGLWKPLVSCAYIEGRKTVAPFIFWVKELLTSFYNLRKNFTDGKYCQYIWFLAKLCPCYYHLSTVLLLVGETYHSHGIPPYLLHKENENSANSCMFQYYFITVL